MVRDLWLLTEPYHALAYFAPEVVEADTRLGLKGFWMSYFAGRAAPMGAVGPEVVTATFFNFAPPMVARALPDAWSCAPPAAVVATRLETMKQVLGTLLGDHLPPGDVAEAARLARVAADACVTVGRPLASAWAALDGSDSPVLDLWLALSGLREHRGDGHVVALTEAQLDGCEAHVVLVAAGRSTRDVQLGARGWTEADWTAAVERLRDRGWLDASGSFTVEGRARHRAIEDTTDRLAAPPWDVLGSAGQERLAELMSPIRSLIFDAGLIRFPNPMGLVKG